MSPINVLRTSMFAVLLFAQTQVLAQDDFKINPGISALWVDAADSGHGVMLDLLTPKLAWMCWFVFDLDGNNAWVCGVGSIEGDTISFSAFTVEGGVFPPATNPELINEIPWGTITIVFSDCNNGFMTWQTEAEGYQSGSMVVSRLSSIDGLDCNALLPPALMTIPNTGILPTLDGVISGGEWDNAVQVDIEVTPDWIIPVLLQVDGNSLHAAFTNIAGPNNENRVNPAQADTKFPELFIDSTPDETEVWDLDNYWFHTSFQDCFGQGTWRKVNRCGNQGNSWDGTNWPLAAGQTVIEMSIHYSAMGLALGESHIVNFFATVTSSLLGDFVYVNWPETAEADRPASWQRVRFE